MFHEDHCNYSLHANANYIFRAQCHHVTMATIGERILQMRTERKMTQDELAKLAKVSRVAVTKWESGATENLKLSNLTALCDIFGTTYDFLITGHSESHLRLMTAEPSPVVYLASQNAQSESAEEIAVIAGFRACDSKDRDLIKLITARALEDFRERSGNT